MQPEYLNVNEIPIAYRRTNIKPDGILWLGGFKSDMFGSKATALNNYCELHQIPFTRFDYSGHGESGGEFEKGLISKWANEALKVVEMVKPSLTISSSLGAWINLLLAQKYYFKGIILIAPAPDFTSKLMWPQFSTSAKDEILTKGRWIRPSPYDPAGYPITKLLIEDGLQQNVMDFPLQLPCPVHILHGLKDEEVSLNHVLELITCLEGTQMRLTLIKDGDHSLSRPQDIKCLLNLVQHFLRV